MHADPSRRPRMKAETSFPIPSQAQASQQGLARSRAAMLGLEEAFDDIPGITASMLIAFGNSGIRTTQDLPACVPEHLLGWTERRRHNVTMHPCILGDMGESPTPPDTL